VKPSTSVAASFTDRDACDASSVEKIAAGFRRRFELAE